MANYYIKLTTKLPGSETLYWKEESDNWTSYSADRTVYTSKAKADTGLSLLPKEGMTLSGITTSVKI